MRIWGGNDAAAKAVNLPKRHLSSWEQMWQDFSDVSRDVGQGSCKNPRTLHVIAGGRRVYRWTSEQSFAIVHYLIIPPAANRGL